VFAFLISTKSDPFGQQVEELNDFETCTNWKSSHFESEFSKKRKRSCRVFIDALALPLWDVDPLNQTWKWETIATIAVKKSRENISAMGLFKKKKKKKLNMDF
jgi:hypothetical protein